MNPKPRKVVDSIKLHNIKEASMNLSALKGLGRINNILSRLVKFGIISFLMGGMYLYFKNDYIHSTQYIIKDLENKIASMSNKEKFYLNLHRKLMLEYTDKSAMDNAEDNMGIIEMRKKLISKYANGLVLETCCGTFRNGPYYNSQSVEAIIGIDWCHEMLELASLNIRDNVRLIQMDSTDIEYQDDAFDTVVDTFGLQCSHDYVKQYNEMKRVCKRGGKIILMEIGESTWKSINYKTIKSAPEEFSERGQHLYRNWENVIRNDKDIRIIKSKRKINGRLYAYILEKL